MSIIFGYKNKLLDATAITENSSRPYYGTAYLIDSNLNSVYRGTSGNGTSAILFSFGSAVYMDSVVCITNLTTSGTLWLTAGTISSALSFTSGIPLDGLGTSHKYFGNQGFQFWKINLFGVTAIFKHQVNEISLFKRLLIAEMPSYPVDNSVEEDTTELISERGQKWVYYNYEREGWVFNFEGINAVTESGLFNMYKFVRKDTQPFFMALDPINNPNDIKYVRFRDNAFLSAEVTKNVFDLTLELSQEV